MALSLPSVKVWKAILAERPIPTNAGVLAIDGLLNSITCTKISGFESSQAVMDLPDKTRTPSGLENPTEITFEVPMHHSLEVNELETWREQCLEQIVAGFKRNATFVYHSMDAARRVKGYVLEGCWINSEKTPDVDRGAEPSMATVTFTMQVDSVSPITGN